MTSEDFAMVLALAATGPICTAHCWVNPLSLRGGQSPITRITQTVTGKLTDSKRASTVSPTATADMTHTRRFFA